MQDLLTYLESGIVLMKEYSFTILSAVIVLIVGLWIISMISKSLRRLMQKKDMDPSLQSFLGSLVSIFLKVLLVISVISMLGVEATSFIAILGAAGLAVGMALSGTLQNFAGGVLILIFRPFKVGDYIVAQGYEGVVEELQVFVTTLVTPDNKAVIIPNGPLANDTMINVTRKDKRRVDITFGIAYGDSIDEAKNIIRQELNKNDQVLKEPESTIVVTELADSSVNIQARVWCETSRYWETKFALIESVKKAFDNGGITIPFPQQDVYVHNIEKN